MGGPFYLLVHYKDLFCPDECPVLGVVTGRYWPNLACHPIDELNVRF